MLRLAVLLLLLANAGYFAWTQGLLRAWGLAPLPVSEPQRLQQQIRPESLRLLRPDEIGRLQGQVSAASRTECLLAGPIDEPAQLAGLRQALEPWPAGSWSLEPAVVPASWIVYLGRYASVEHAARKKAELRRIGVSFEALAEPDLEPGIALGRFASEAAAGEQRRALAERGVRSAEVVQERPERRGQLLKLAAVDERLRPRLDQLRPTLHAIKLRPCS
jgi:hypothetical protein